jgi:flavin reductase (DIM6/NTAB) family NADH-FMN oxidoreductase RutF
MVGLWCRLEGYGVTHGQPELLSAFWAPLCAIGAHDAEGRPNAQICVSVFGASIVPERPRLMVILSKTNYTTGLVGESGTLAITLLSEEQSGLLAPLGLRSGRDGDKLAGLDYGLTNAGDPWFEGGVGWIGCEVLSASDFGDSTGYLCAVRERVRLEGRSHLPWSRAREIVGAEFLERWAEKSAREQEAARKTMLWRE